MPRMLMLAAEGIEEVVAVVVGAGRMLNWEEAFVPLDTAVMKSRLSVRPGRREFEERGARSCVHVVLMFDLGVAEEER